MQSGGRYDSTQLKFQGKPESIWSLYHRRLVCPAQITSPHLLRPVHPAPPATRYPPGTSPRDTTTTTPPPSGLLSRVDITSLGDQVFSIQVLVCSDGWGESCVPDVGGTPIIPEAVMPPVAPPSTRGPDRSSAPRGGMGWGGGRAGCRGQVFRLRLTHKTLDCD